MNNSERIKLLFKNPKAFFVKFKWFILMHFIKFLFKQNENIPEICDNWYYYCHLQKKYQKYLDDLPLYKWEGKKRKKTKENIIRRCRLQGEKNIPPLNRNCLNSVKKIIKNKKIIIITNDNLKEYINIPWYIYEKHKSGIISNAHFSDLIRLNLLIEYWWTWIDSTVLLTNYNKVFFESDFFVFRNFYRGEKSMALSNWFITSNRNNPILLTTRDLLYKYRKDNNYLINYYIFHMFFTMAIQKYPEIWDAVPKYSNLPPHIMQYELLSDYDKKRFEQLKSISSIHKLNFKINKSIIWEKSLYKHIEYMNI